MENNPIIAGNWKMNKTPSEGNAFISEIMDRLAETKNINIILSPPFTGLYGPSLDYPFFKAAQNCHWEEKGAYTGEISVSMIKDCNAKFVIIGHSERRHVFGELDEHINLKVSAVMSGGLKPILCIGETLEQRQQNKTNSVIKSQIEKGLKGISSFENIVIAYEPVWAIGTGLTAEENQIYDAHERVRITMRELYGENLNIQVLYGGSVNSKNADSLIQVSGVDGFLIGGASLDIESFTSIVKIVEKIQGK